MSHSKIQKCIVKLIESEFGKNSGVILRNVKVQSEFTDIFAIVSHKKAKL